MSAIYITVSTVLEAVAATFDLSVMELRSPRRGSKLLWMARAAACLLARDLTEKTYLQIGHSLGLRDHTTILHAVRKGETYCKTDPEFAAKVAAARTAIQVVARSQLARLLDDPDPVAVARRLCADPIREATQVSTLETLALAVRLLTLEDIAGGAFVLLGKMFDAPEGSDIHRLRQDNQALIEAITETLASLGYGEPGQPTPEAKETLHV
jgi:chromosomal replication initiator protein